MGVAYFTKRALSYLIIILMAIFSILPLFVMTYQSLKTEHEFAFNPAGIVFKPSLENYIEAINMLKRPLLNSLISCSLCTFLTILTCSFTGYLLASYSFKGRKFIFVTIASGLGVPPQAYIIPLAMFAVYANLYNNIIGLGIIFFLYSVTGGVLYFTNYYLTNVPKELIEAAHVDGCGILSTYVRIILPLSPTIIALVLSLNFTSWYNNLLWPLVLTAGPESQTVPIIIASTAGRTLVKWTLQMAISVIASIPAMLIYLIAARYISRGALASLAMKR